MFFRIQWLILNTKLVNNMSVDQNLDRLVDNYLSKVNICDNLQGKLNIDSLPNTESVLDLLQRVTKTPQILKNLITTSLPYLLISPEMDKNNEPAKTKRKMKKSNKDNSVSKSESVMVGKKMSVQAVNESSKLKKLIVEASGGKQLVKKPSGVNKKKIVQKKPSANRLHSVINLKTILNLNLDNAEDEGDVQSALKKTFNYVLDDNAQKKLANALKNSTLFSITEKSFLSLNNYAPVEMDTLILQKLVNLDREVGRQLIFAVLNDGEIKKPPEPTKDIQSASKKDLKRALVNELYDILVTRLKSSKERPAEILYNVVLKLCRKNKIELLGQTKKKIAQSVPLKKSVENNKRKWVFY